MSFDYFQLDGPDPSNVRGSATAPVTTFDGDALDTDTLERDRPQDDRRSTRSSNGNADGHHDRRRDLPDRRPAAARFILQAADHAGADWVLETKLTNTLDGGYSQGGILVYGDDNNYVKFNAISDDGQAPGQPARAAVRGRRRGQARRTDRRSPPRRRPDRSGCG